MSANKQHKFQFIQQDWYERWQALAIHVCKVPTASTATKNPLDVGPIFRSLKSLEKSLNAADFASKTKPIDSRDY